MAGYEASRGSHSQKQAVIWLPRIALNTQHNAAQHSPPDTGTKIDISVGPLHYHSIADRRERVSVCVCVSVRKPARQRHY